MFKPKLEIFNITFFFIFTTFPNISQNFCGLKKLFYHNKIPTLAELKEIPIENQIRGYSYYTKSKLIDLLDKRGLTPEKI